jgi:hypothetical protein
VKGAKLRDAAQDPANKELQAAVDAWGIYGDDKSLFDLK